MAIDFIKNNRTHLLHEPKENILKRQELINEDEDKLFTDKDFSKATPVDLSLHREMEKVHLKFGNIPASKRR